MIAYLFITTTGTCRMAISRARSSQFTNQHSTQAPHQPPKVPTAPTVTLHTARCAARACTDNSCSLAAAHAHAAPHSGTQLQHASQDALADECDRTFYAISSSRIASPPLPPPPITALGGGTGVALGVGCGGVAVWLALAFLSPAEAELGEVRAG
eukprot:scaffold25495_cov121-Isochrysis_galbana.AAC.9